MRAPLTAFIATPAPAGSTAGNRITALRWAKRLRELGWTVRVGTAWQGEPCDLLVALHAMKSHDSLVRHAAQAPDVPRILALTGTDLFGDLEHDARARESLELAARIVLLQPRGLELVPAGHRSRARVIRQSAVAPAVPRATIPTACVLAHLRDIKDPLVVARAAELLPEQSAWRIVHLGAATDDHWRARAAAATERGRWRWLGPVVRRDALRVLAASHLLVLPSRSEGGANVVTEAIAAGVPVLSTRIEGSLGILGEDYPGYFEIGDAAGLARLLVRCEDEPAFLDDLRARIAALAPLVDPARERASWREVLDELVLP